MCVCMYVYISASHVMIHFVFFRAQSAPLYFFPFFFVLKNAPWLESTTYVLINTERIFVPLAFNRSKMFRHMENIIERPLNRTGEISRITWLYLGWRLSQWQYNTGRYSQHFSFIFYCRKYFKKWHRMKRKDEYLKTKNIAKINNLIKESWLKRST